MRHFRGRGFCFFCLILHPQSLNILRLAVRTHSYIEISFCWEFCSSCLILAGEFDPKVVNHKELLSWAVQCRNKVGEILALLLRWLHDLGGGTFRQRPHCLLGSLAGSRHARLSNLYLVLSGPPKVAGNLVGSVPVVARMDLHFRHGHSSLC